MTNENLVVNGNFEDGLDAWRDPSKQVKAATVRGKTAALFQDRDLALWQAVGGKKSGKYLGPGTYTCSFLATQDGILSGVARVEAIIWDGGNPVIGGAGAVVKLEPGATDWVAKSFTFSIELEKSWVDLALSSTSRAPGEDQSEHLGIAITGVELTKNG